MANTKPIHTESFEASGDLSGKQFYGVKLSADRTMVIAAAITDKCIGILQDKPTNGVQGLVMVIGRTKVVAAETLVAGDQIRIDDNGKAAKMDPSTDTTAYIVGVVTVGASTGFMAEALVNFAAQARGA